MTLTTELLCPPEWADVVTNAMDTALPAPRTPGPDTVRVALLIRQSKAREDDSHGGPRAQLDAGLHLVQSPANARWHVGPEHVFADIGVSGWAPNIKRPGFDGVMDAVRAGSLDVIVVYALSRLSRKGALDVLNIVNELREHGVRLVSVTEPWLDTDPNNPIGQAILGLTAALAQQESQQKSSFITDALAQARMRGGHVTGKAPYGMAIEREMVDGVMVNKLVPHPDLSEHALRMVELAEKEMDRYEIAETLTAEAAPTPSGNPSWIGQTVFNLLRDPRWAGYSVDAFTRLEVDSNGHKKRRPIRSEQAILYSADGSPVELHQGLITRDRWWRLQKLLGVDASRIKVRTARESSRTLHGLFQRLQILSCAVCGRPMQTNPGDDSGRYPFYSCTKGPGGPKGAGKHTQGVTVSGVDETVAVEAFNRLRALDPANESARNILTEIARKFALQDAGDETAQLKQAAERELGHVQGALKNLAKDRELGLYDGPTMSAEYVSSVRRLAKTEQRLTETIAELVDKQASAVSIPGEWFNYPEDRPTGEGSLWARWTLEDKRRFLVSMVRGVAVKPVGRKGNHMPVEARLAIMWVGEPVESADTK